MLYHCDTLTTREHSPRFRAFLGRFQPKRVRNVWMREFLILSRTPGISLPNLFGSKFDAKWARSVLSEYDSVDVGADVELNLDSINGSDCQRMLEIWNGRCRLSRWAIAHQLELKHRGAPFDQRVVGMMFGGMNWE